MVNNVLKIKHGSEKSFREKTVYGKDLEFWKIMIKCVDDFPTAVSR